MNATHRTKEKWQIMNYEDTLKYIHSFSMFTGKPGTHRIKKFMELLGNPQDRLKFVHIAGTNGKGSVAAMTASVLTNAGYKTGMYTSPYIIDFRERMQIDFKMISKEELSRLTIVAKEYAEKFAQTDEPLSEFELITAIAFLWFAKQGCDIVVLETGLGGKYDATNVIKNPLVSVITSISLDHTKVLGDNTAQIAKEKCGIIKPNSITVSYPLQEDCVIQVIKSSVEKKNNILYVGDMHKVYVLESNLEGSKISYQGMLVHIPLIGRHQIANGITALETINALKSKGYLISEESIIDGMKNAKWQGRMEVIANKPYVIVDGAHNLSGIQALARALQDIALNKITVIFGMLEDKDYLGALETITPICDQLMLITPNHPRAAAYEKLLPKAKALCNYVRGFNTLEEAYKESISSMGANDTLVICGSLYIVADAKKCVEKVNSV